MLGWVSFEIFVFWRKPGFSSKFGFDRGVVLWLSGQPYLVAARLIIPRLRAPVAAALAKYDVGRLDVAAAGNLSGSPRRGEAARRHGLGHRG
jgi:hypothetical protein